MEESPLDHLIRIHKALAHPVRVRILAMLRGGELCVCQLNAVIGLAPSTISAHLGELKDAGLIGERKEGRWVHYRLVAAEVRKDALAALWPALAADPLIADDAAFFYLGELVESGRAEDLFTRPREPRTEAYVTGRFG